MANVDALMAQFQKGDRLALSRLLSLLARGEDKARILAALPAAAPAKTIAITGSAGVGKSTLIGKLIEHIRKDGKKVAVLACDPQSPLSGGALLGDRFRMPSLTDEGVFIRSLPALSGHGAVADHLPDMVRLLSAFGFDLVLIETVGAGQGDVTVSNFADVVVLLLQPETGDDLQWEKAGVLEVADLIAVQKADMPKAEAVAAQVRAALDLSDITSIPVLLVSAKTGQGVAELWRAIANCKGREHTGEDPYESLLKMMHEELADRFSGARQSGNETLDKIVRQYQEGLITGHEAIHRVFDLLICSLRTFRIQTVCNPRPEKE